MTIQRKATIISSTVAFLLVIIKLIVGLLSGSVAVIASAIDSILDFSVSLFNHFAVINSEKPADSRFNYGRGKIEALASVIEGSVITVSGVFILYQAIKKALYPEEISHLDISIIVMLISFVVTLFLVVFLNFVAKKSNSLLIKADALHYKTDLYSNGAILISLALIYVTNIGVIDSIIGGLIAIYIIYSAYEIIKEGTLILLDVSLEDELVEQIRTVIKSDSDVNNFHWLRTRKAGKYNFVDVHLVFNKQISLMEAHQISDRVEEQIKLLDEKSEWVIHIHLDPVDDSFAISEALKIDK